MLLEKHNFLRMPEVSDFSEWLSEMSDKLTVELKIKKSRFVENEIETNCVGFQKILDNDPLMYQFILNLNGKKHMWFDTENAFNDNVYDFIIQSMVRLDKISKKKRITENDTNNYLNICFEKFVTNIFHYNEKIERFLNLNSTTSTKRFIKKNKLNKKYLHDRKWKHTYFGWKLEENLETKKKYFDKLNFIKKKCSKDNFQNLIELCKNYENKFGLKFPNTNNF